MRAFLIGASVVLLVGAAALFVFGLPQPGGLVLVFWAVILFVGVFNWAFEPAG